MSIGTSAAPGQAIPQTHGFAIEVEGLRKTYGSLVAVDGISFRVQEREIFGILGPNGAGKTTTVEILEGLRQADSGRAVVAGIDVRKEPQRVKSLIGVQLQASAFFDFSSTSAKPLSFSHWMYPIHTATCASSRA